MIEQKLNPDIHIICGKCGNKNMFKYSIQKDWLEDSEGNQREGVSITCGNCSTLTGLDEVMEEGQ